MSPITDLPSLRPPKNFVHFDDGELEHSLVDRFEQIASKFPKNTAITSKDEKITYQSLNESSNRLAHAILSEIGSSPEPVAIILGHDAPAIQAIWGILKSDHAYVILIPSLPSARICQILEDMQARLIVSDNQNLITCKAALPENSKIEIINLDHLEESLRSTNPGLSIPVTNMAYIVYTSGSTGAPKGAIQLHQNVMCATLSQINELWISHSDRIALFLYLGYDAARFGIYGAALTGATLCMYDIRSMGINGLPDWINQERITVLHSTPSILRQAMNLIPKNRCFPSVRAINLGGEPATSYDVHLYHQHFSRKCSLSNSLGSTETQTIARYTIDQQTKIKGDSIPIGFPLFGKTIELVDDSGHTVGVDEIGEIIVKSRYISPGYWRRPDLTAEKFSFDLQDSELRIFRTGDLGCFRPEGYLEYFGRKDTQIKIRGMRIELAEIEAVLLQQAGVRNAIVIAREVKQSSDDKQLVAYVELENNVALSRLQLHNSLGRRLPEYMLPTFIVLLEKLPLTSTGKVDRLALPSPEEVNQAQKHSYIPPRDATETQLVKIFEHILRIQPVGIKDNFFELGGNSLLAAQLFNQIERRFHKKLPLATLFQAPSIEQLGAILRQENWVPDWSSLVALQSNGVKPPLFLAAPVGGNVLSYRDLMTHLPADQPCYGLQAVGLDGIQLPKRDVIEIAAHYINEIRTIQPTGPYYLAGSSFGGLVVYEMAQQLHDMGQSVALVVMFDAYGPNYPRRMPGMSRFRRRLFKYVRRAESHFSNIQYANWQGKFTYIQTKGKKLLSRFSRQISRKLDQVIHPLPRELRMVKAAGYNAGKKRSRYARQARRFGSRLVLFRASKQPLGIYPDPTLGWGAVVGEDVEVYEIPGHHTSLIYEPRVHMIADKLREILAQVQTNN
jgi:amino acid adenylation domain-containing protein